MRTVAGLLLFHGLILMVGSAFLTAVRMVAPRPGELTRAVGLAHLTGVAATCVTAICVLVLGGTLTAPFFVVIALSLFAVLVAIAFLRRGEVTHGGGAVRTVGRATPGWPVIVVGLGIAVFIAAGLLSSQGMPTAWDAAHNWTLKAIVLLNQGDLSSGAFRDSGLFAGAHQDYPILQPVLGSLALRFTARADQSLLVAELWLLVAAFVGAVVFLLRNRAGWTVLVLAPLGIAIASGPIQGVVRGDADVTMAVFIAVGVLCIGLWTERPAPGLLPVAAVLLAAAANTKNEGMVFAIGVAVVALLAGLVRPAHGVRRLVLMGLAVGAAAVPWRVWVASHGPFPSDVRSLGDALSPSLLADSLHQLDFAAQEILSPARRRDRLRLAVPRLPCRGAADDARGPGSARACSVRRGGARDDRGSPLDLLDIASTRRRGAHREDDAANRDRADVRGRGGTRSHARSAGPCEGRADRSWRLTESEPN